MTTTESEAVFDLLEFAGKLMEGKAEYWDALFDRQSSCSISRDNVDERVALLELAGIQLRSFKNGILIEQFSWLNPDRMATGFSSEIRNAYLIKNGECTQALKGGMVSGKALDMIKNISGISNQQFIESGATAFSCVPPYIRFENVQVVGK